MGYRLNRLDGTVLIIAVPEPLLTEFGIHHRLESCAYDCALNNFVTENYCERYIKEQDNDLKTQLIIVISCLFS